MCVFGFFVIYVLYIEYNLWIAYEVALGFSFSFLLFAQFSAPSYAHRIRMPKHCSTLSSWINEHNLVSNCTFTIYIRTMRVWYVHVHVRTNRTYFQKRKKEQQEILLPKCKILLYHQLAIFILWVCCSLRNAFRLLSRKCFSDHDYAALIVGKIYIQWKSGPYLCIPNMFYVFFFPYAELRNAPKPKNSNHNQWL